MGLLLSLIGADYVARVMRAHTTSQPRPWPDVVASVGVAALWMARIGGFPALPLLLLFSLWLGARYLVTIARILSAWRQHWVWINSAGETAP